MSMGTISGNSLFRKLAGHIPNATNKDIRISDNNYRLFGMNDVIQTIKLDRVNEMKYENDTFDCEDYSIALMGFMRKMLKGIAFGMMWVNGPKGPHSINFFIDEDRDLWCVEPQNHMVFKLPKNYVPYFFIV